MEFYLQLALLAIFGVVATMAVRATIRVRALAVERGLQRATLLACADVMANEKNTAKARDFASLIAVFSLSDKVMASFGRDHKLLRSKMEELHQASEAAQGGGLTDADKKAIQPALSVFALSCLLRDPASSIQVKRIWEQLTAESYARANSSAPAQSKVRATEAAQKPMQDRILKVEDEVIDTFSDLCHA
ncbi:hypothetical protein QEK78_001802 [Stenotrophomonas maltophilia]|nr:hypothetical protein [Stenotrophomonas maltophilia]HDS1829168.1 hypothetical protein [Stenotrophomonas maltophilia]